MKSNLNIRTFKDYRTFLLAYLEDAKKRNPKFSFASWAQKLDSVSKASLVKILQGKRKPGKKTVSAFVRYFDFNFEEESHFKLLIEVDRKSNMTGVSDAILRSFVEHHDMPSAKLDKQTIAAIQEWYHVPILALISSKTADLSVKKIAAVIGQGLKEKDVVTAIETFLSVGIVRKAKSGRLQIARSWQAFQPVKLSPQNLDLEELSRRFHVDTLKYTTKKIEKLEWAKCDNRVVAIPLNKKKLTEAKQLIREFSDRFAKLMEDDSSPDVFHLQIQFFPIQD